MASFPKIAIIGMAGRFPGADSVDAFWRNLEKGIESISRISTHDLLSSGIPQAMMDAPNYVRCGGILEGANLFDAAFFGVTPKDAELMDPQHRVFLECCWEALEHAGYVPERYAGSIGLYAGAGWSAYSIDILQTHGLANADLDAHQIITNNDKDFLSSRVSYKLNLTGPSISVQTACSTSLVAVCLACSALQAGQCDMALAGGVSISSPQAGYFHVENGITSPDGHCRAFDRKAEGTVRGNGAGVIVLRRYEDAVRDRDCIHAVIRGAAVNNDGSRKLGFAAPSLQGQVDVLTRAYAGADIDPSTVSYVEAHGTGTRLGDLIELSALDKVFRPRSRTRNGCALGSVKANVGHLDTAAGVAGLIKTVMAIKERKLPPSLHFEQPSREFDVASSPFRINDRLSEWTSDLSAPRRAGVSSFGIGGTNAHVILEEAPEIRPAAPQKPYYLIPISGRTPTALESATETLGAFLTGQQGANIEAVAYTYQAGRRTFANRSCVRCRDRNDALSALATRDPDRLFTPTAGGNAPPVVFMFPGQGAQHSKMASELYRLETAFREAVDQCTELLVPLLHFDIRESLFQAIGSTETARHRLDETWLTQPAVFLIDYALARLWQALGLVPDSMVGHSLGEYVAACISGVFSLEDALRLVVERGRLMHGLPTGAMLAARVSEQYARSVPGGGVSLAAINGPTSCVVSGPTAEIDRLQNEWTSEGISCRRLVSARAFHSIMVEPATEPFLRLVRAIRPQVPRVPFLSNLTGNWITAAEATSPEYWAAHMREPVRFHDAIAVLERERPNAIFLEVGPGQVLQRLVQQRPSVRSRLVLSTVADAQEGRCDESAFVTAVGRLWVEGVSINWDALYPEKPYRTPAPGHPFERKAYRYTRPGSPGQSAKAEAGASLSMPAWENASHPRNSESPGSDRRRWLVFGDNQGLVGKMVERLEASGLTVTVVDGGAEFARASSHRYVIRSREMSDYVRLLDENGTPHGIVHAWGLGPAAEENPSDSELLCSLLFLAQALGERPCDAAVDTIVLLSGAQQVGPSEPIVPARAAVLGLCRVIPQEYPTILCRTVDCVLWPAGGWEDERLVKQLTAEVLAGSGDKAVAYRGHDRFLPAFVPVERLAPPSPPRLRANGVYLIVGGLGKIGMQIAEYLARATRSKLVLTGRNPFPPKREWKDRLAGAAPQDEITRKIGTLLRLEELGAESEILTADVSCYEDMRQAWVSAKTRFGRIDGVFHCAGVTVGRSIRPIRDLAMEHYMEQFAAKAEGLRVLETVLRDDKLDFVVCASSLSAIVGGAEFGAYAPANVFMDAFVRLHNLRSQVPWTTVNWDGWRLGVDGDGQSRLDQGLTAAEAGEALGRILSMVPVSQVIVSKGDLRARLERRPNPAPRKAQPANPQTDRAAAGVPFVLPRTEVERIVSALWEDLLGVTRISSKDNFFDLGGDSLLAVQFCSRLLASHGVRLPVRIVFECPTVEELACAVAERTHHTAAGTAQLRAATGERTL